MPEPSDIRISVVIPCYRQAQYLGDAVGSALAQDVDGKEVIVVNDGSPDATRVVAASFGDAVRYIEQENRGLSSARNAGIRAARGAYVAFLDSDDYYLPGTLSTLAAYLDRHPRVGLVCGDALLVKDDEVVGRKSERSGRPRRPGNFRWETVEYCATPSTVMMRRHCFHEVGPFDERLRNAAEDWHLWMRLSLACDMAYLDRPLTAYRLHRNNATHDAARMAEGNRYAIASIVDAPYFTRYPATFRARALVALFAAYWTASPRRALRHLCRALSADPGQALFGLRVMQRGVRNTLRRTVAHNILHH